MWKQTILVAYLLQKQPSTWTQGIPAFAFSAFRVSYAVVLLLTFSQNQEYKCASLNLKFERKILKQDRSTYDNDPTAGGHGEQEFILAASVSNFWKARYAVGLFIYSIWQNKTSSDKILDFPEFIDMKSNGRGIPNNNSLRLHEQ
jgi:hypothetical protein